MYDTKLCPYCSEEIKETAIKCRYCGTMLSNALPSSGSVGGITLVRQALSARYQKQEEIGRGGMATVYRALQKNLNRPVALKVIHQNLVHDSEFVARFHREAQVCASLQHPNIVTVYDEGELGGVHFMAMELLDGHDLHRIIRQQGQLSVEQTLIWLAPIAEALQYAHSRGIIHRDIKSSNILITQSGRTVLMDFGIAYAASGTRLTQTGLVIGTPEYMSPEQAEGRSIDQRTDIYSLGIVLYECLTGKVPFKADNPLSIIMKVVNEAPMPPMLHNKSLPIWLNEVVMQCIAKNPENRFADAGQLAKALSARQQSQPLPPPAPPVQTGSKAPTPVSYPAYAAPPKKSISVLKIYIWLLALFLVLLWVYFAYLTYVDVFTAYRKAEQENTTQAYENYLYHYGWTDFSGEIRKKLEQLQNTEQELHDFNLAARSEKTETLERFLDDYPSSIYKTEVEELIAEKKLLKDGLFDQRDGKVYKVTKIDNQIWMAENLNIGVEINQFEDFQNDGVIQKRCLDDDCDKIGGLYSWGEAVQYVNGAESYKMWTTTPDGNIKGICPDGWHLPSDDEWCTLVTFIDPKANCSKLGVISTDAGRKLRSRELEFSNGEKGTDDFGFRMLYGGFLGPGPIGYDWYAVGARFCVSAKQSANKRLWWGYDLKTIWMDNMDLNDEHQTGISRYEDHRDLFSVRCVKDDISTVNQ